MYYTQTDTFTHRYTDRNTQTHILTDRQRCTYTYTHTFTEAQANRQVHKHNIQFSKKCSAFTENICCSVTDKKLDTFSGSYRRTNVV